MAQVAAVSGSVEPGWEAVREAFAAGQAQDRGAAQLAVHHHGRLTVDLWSAGAGPHAESGPTSLGPTSLGPTPFGPDSVGVMMSVTKGLVAVCAHLLSERGQLELDAPVARYWPQFAAAGKARTTVADLLTHRAGLPAFGDGSGSGNGNGGLLPDSGGLKRYDPDLRDWDGCVSALARMRPLWKAGSAVLYHALTYGHLVGEVVRQVTGMSLGAFFASEVAGPLGLDMWIGLPQEEEYRYVPQFSVRPDPSAEQVTAFLAGLGLPPDEPLAGALKATAAELAAVTAGFASRAGRAAEIPGAGGIGNARSLSRLYASLCGPVDGVRLLSPRTVDRARVPRTDRLPPPVPLDGSGGGSDAHRSRFGLGFELPRPGLPMLGAGSFGHAGAGGRLGMAHPESGLAVGYWCAAMAWEPASGPDPRWVRWTQALGETVRVPAL